MNKRRSRACSGSSLNRSGAMYANEPIWVPAMVSRVSPWISAIPKSTRYAKSAGVTMMFCGLMSRWINLSACAASSAAATC